MQNHCFKIIVFKPNSNIFFIKKRLLSYFSKLEKKVYKKRENENVES